MWKPKSDTDRQPGRPLVEIFAEAEVENFNNKVVARPLIETWCETCLKTMQIYSFSTETWYALPRCPKCMGRLNPTAYQPQLERKDYEKVSDIWNKNWNKNNGDSA